MLPSSYCMLLLLLRAFKLLLYAFKRLLRASKRLLHVYNALLRVSKRLLHVYNALLHVSKLLLHVSQLLLHIYIALLHVSKQTKSFFTTDERGLLGFFFVGCRTLLRSKLSFFYFPSHS